MPRLLLMEGGASKEEFGALHHIFIDKIDHFIPKISFEVMVALPVLPAEMGGFMSVSNFIQPSELRAFAGNFATGVAVVTTRGADGRCCGLTMNAVTSLSLSPPLLLICLDNEASTLRALEESNHFCLHFLAADQQAISADTFNCVKQMKEFGVDPTMKPITPLVYANKVRCMGLNRSMSMALAPAVAMSCRSAGPSAAAMAPRSASRLCASLRWRRPRFSITDKVT